MANYKHYMNRDFAGCQLLAYAYDNHRNRDVRLFKMPGIVEDVGVSDGTDTWIAPVSASIFSINVQRIMQDIQAGRPIATPVKGMTEPGVVTRRRAVIASEPAQPIKSTRRKLLEAPTLTQTTGARRVLFS